MKNNKVNFIYEIPTKIYFGCDNIKFLSDELNKYGKKVLLVYGGGSIKKNGLYDEIINEIKSADIELFELSGIEPNPRHTSVNEGARICKENNIDVVLAVGGGSVIDAAKFISTGAFYEGDVWDIVTKKVNITKALPIVDILTILATGSEMDCSGVITNLDTKEKIGCKSSLLRPKVSFLDPSNTYSVSAYQTACGSADILSHIIETYFSPTNGLYMLDKIMEGLMKTVIKYVPIAIKDPNNYEARANLMWASSWAINDFIRYDKSHSWSCHAMEHQLSAFYDITHGLGLAILTPRWMEYVLDDITVSKFYDFGVNVFSIDCNLPKMEVAKKSIVEFKKFLYEDLGLTSNLLDLDINEEYFEEMASRICKNGNLPGFKSLNKEDIINIYKMCLK